MYEQQHVRRHPGVKVPEGQNIDRTDKPDLTVLDMVDVQMKAGRYVENGKIRTGLFLLVGKVWHLAPDGEAWLRKCRQVSEKLTKNIVDFVEARDGVHDKDVPATDTVDVIAAETAADKPKAAPDKDPVDIIAEA